MGDGDQTACIVRGVSFLWGYPIDDQVDDFSHYSSKICTIHVANGVFIPAILTMVDV